MFTTQPPAEILRRIVGTLKSAQHQRVPSDDKIIGEHIDEALTLAETLVSTPRDENARGTEYGWVIELGESSVSAPKYWIGGSTWSSNNLEAIRFAREEDASRAAFMMLDGVNVRICEHAWG